MRLEEIIFVSPLGLRYLCLPKYISMKFTEQKLKGVFVIEWSQSKLVRVTQGRVYDVVVDLRRTSPTFGQYVGIELSDENKKQLFVPRGFAHGFAVLSETAQFCYKVDNVYAPHEEVTLFYNDPHVAVQWPIKAEEMLLSEKDKKGLGFEEIEVFE